MSPAHFVAFYVVLPPFVGLLVLQLVLWLVAEALAGTGAKGRSCEIARLLGYEPEAGHSCRYCWCAARRCADVARAGSDSALRRRYVRHHALILLSYCSFLPTFLPTKRTAEKKGNLASLSVFSWVRCTPPPPP
jgi:hypothetical protein